ncbi:hypothetical protein [Mycobacterium sp. 852002-51057_SCH5723018]|uniref:hypothetical protein n=1 Tax=Mycobacterium sp. 852002-51057_SCH5723018 TaxID=1834094 RepID=UPI000AC1C1AA|nr:hypothetical protein [Mycobacterium sp. 852002-51057_SCH5723018]
MGEPDETQPKPEQNQGTADTATTSEPVPVAAYQSPPNPLANGSPSKSKRRRSNEFWLAITGIAATLVGGALGSLITYQTSSRQIQATAEQSALQFNKQQRLTAYANYNDSVTNLSNDEFRLAQAFAQFPQADVKSIHSEFDPYEDDFKKNNLYSSTVALVRSKGVVDAHAALATKHNDLHNRFAKLLIAAERGDVSTVQIQVQELGENLNSGDLVKKFVSAAKHDVGMDD